MKSNKYYLEQIEAAKIYGSNKEALTAIRTMKARTKKAEAKGLINHHEAETVLEWLDKIHKTIKN